MGKVIGIDLGTTNSVVALETGQQVTVMADGQGRRGMPSVIGLPAHPHGQ